MPLPLVLHLNHLLLGVNKLHLAASFKSNETFMAFLRTQSIFYNSSSTRTATYLARMESELKKAEQNLKAYQKEIGPELKKGSTEAVKAEKERYEHLNREVTEKRRKKALVESQIQLFFADELASFSEQLFNIGANLARRDDVLKDECIYNVAEDALFNAKDLLLIILRLKIDFQPEDRELEASYGQKYRVYQERSHLFETAWTELYKRREKWLQTTLDIPVRIEDEATVVKVDSKESSGKAQSTVRDLAGQIYGAAFIFYSLARDLSEHPNIFKNQNLEVIAMNAYSRASSIMMSSLGNFSEWWEGYSSRLELFKRAERRFEGAYLDSFLVDDPLLSSATPSVKL